MSLTAHGRAAETEARRASGVVLVRVVVVFQPHEQTERGILTSVALAPGHIRLARALSVVVALAAAGTRVGARRVTVARLAVREAVESRRRAPVAQLTSVPRATLTLTGVLVALTGTRSLQVTVARLKTNPSSLQNESKTCR